jgi:hypothetical protein
MAGTLIVSNLKTDTDNSFIVRSNTGTTLFVANTTGIDVANSFASSSITSDKILTVANTKISGNIISSQITSVANTQITGNIASSQITSNPTLYGNVSVTGVIGVGGATPTTNGSGITFPATFSNSTNANTLDDYEEGSFTVTGTGFTTTITGTAYYTKIGNFVSLSIPDLAGTSNTTAFTITGLPVEIRPLNAFVMGGVRIYNNSTLYYGHIYWAGSGTINCAWDVSENAFTASVIKGITNRFNINYSIV